MHVHIHVHVCTRARQDNIITLHVLLHMYQKGTHNFPFIYVSTSSSYNIRYYVLLVAVSPIYLFIYDFTVF